MGYSTGGGGFGSSIVEGVDVILHPEQAKAGSAVNRGCQTLFEGGYYRAFRPILFNRMTVNVSVVNVVGSDLVAAFYQRNAGVGGNPVSLRGVFVETITATGATEIVGASNVFLEPGVYVLVWGTSTGGAVDYQLTCYNSVTVPPLNFDVAADMRCAEFGGGPAVTTAPPALLSTLASAVSPAADRSPVCRVRLL